MVTTGSGQHFVSEGGDTNTNGVEDHSEGLPRRSRRLPWNIARVWINPVGVEKQDEPKRRRLAALQRIHNPLMPELPEVETVRRVMERALVGHTIAEVEVAPDEIVLGRFPSKALEDHLRGAKVTGVGRKGKYWWIELDKKPWLFGHLGMAGWIREMGEPTIRIREMGNMPLDDEEGRPRFLKLMLTTEEGRRIAMTDGRRLARLWLSDSPEHDRRVGALGYDSWKGLPSSSELHALLKKRKAPLKAILLDQALFAGVGNWIADEVMLKARLSPHRLGISLTEKEAGALKKAIEDVIDLAVEKGADKEQFPPDWLFHVRWGGKKGIPQFDGHDIIREQVGGRTTAWVPDLQK